MRKIIKITGIDAEHFLQSMLTNDIQKITSALDINGSNNNKKLNNKANTENQLNGQYSCFLTPQGKILYDFYIFCEPQIKHQNNNLESENYTFYLACNSEYYNEIYKKLTFYKLRSQILIEKAENISYIATIRHCNINTAFNIKTRHIFNNYYIENSNNEISKFLSQYSKLDRIISNKFDEDITIQSQKQIMDRDILSYIEENHIFTGQIKISNIYAIDFTFYNKNNKQISENHINNYEEQISHINYQSISIMRLLGIPQFAIDFQPGEYFPFDLDLENIAISYNKGCYIGQEVITRTKFRGNARKFIEIFIYNPEKTTLHIEKRQKIYEINQNSSNFFRLDDDITDITKYIGNIIGIYDYPLSKNLKIILAMMRSPQSIT